MQHVANSTKGFSYGSKRVRFWEWLVVLSMTSYGQEYTFETIMRNFKTKFQIRSEYSSTFKYLGMNLTQLPDKSIKIDQNSYVDSIKQIEISAEDSKEPLKLLNEKQVSLLRGIVGQLNWLAGISRPEISFQVSELSSRVKISTISDLKSANKVVKFVKMNPSYIIFPKLRGPLTLKVFVDASFANLHDGGSQGGNIIFLCDGNNSSPILWNSSRIKRIARSTLAAETHACSDSCDAASYLSFLLKEMLPTNEKMPIEVYTDCKSLFDNAFTSNQVSERNLRVHIASIREFIGSEEVTLVRIPSEHQLADILTKKGPSPQKLMQVLRDGVLPCFE